VSAPGAGAARFTFNGRSVTARAGQSIAAALLEAGVTTLTRSSKYRRPRGIYCADGHCPNCMLRVDGTPHVRTCMVPARDGLVVESEGVAARRIDPFRVIDRTGSLFPVGFQYRYFKRQNLAWRLWEGRLRSLAAESELPAPFEIPPAERLAADLLVVGGGPAGLSAAAAAADRGLDVVLATRRAIDPRRSDGAVLAGLRGTLRSHPKVTALAPGTVVAGFGDRYVVDCRDHVVEVTAGSSILATGAYERALAFPGNDRPGVMLTRALVRLVLEQGVVPRGAVALVTDRDWAYAAAAQLARAGCRIAAVVDLRTGERAAPPSDPGMLVLVGAEVLGVRGTGAIRGISVRTVHGTHELACAVVTVSGGWQAADELRYAATSHGDAVVLGERAMPVELGLAGRDLPQLQAVGAVAGCFDAPAAIAEGAVAGAWAAGGDLATAGAELERLRTGGGDGGR
jgi:sarcosine oxidase subunit alpha